MWNSHSSVGLAQTIFYTPALLAAIILLFRRRYEKPKWQWVVLLIFSIGKTLQDWHCWNDNLIFGSPSYVWNSPNRIRFQFCFGGVDYRHSYTSRSWRYSSPGCPDSAYCSNVNHLSLQKKLVELTLFFSQKLDFPTNKPFKAGIIATRAIFLVGIATLIGGSILLGNYKNSNDVSLGSKLAKAGYLIITVVLFFAKCWATGLWLIFKRLSPNSRKV